MKEAFPLHYETHGHPENPGILLVNGLGGQLIHWPPVFIEDLVKQGYYVVLFDNRDIGLSHYYEEFGSPDIQALLTSGKPFTPFYTLYDMADDAITILDKLKMNKAHIVGISMGGIISQLIAYKYPERVLSLTCIASTTNDPALPPAKPEVTNYFFAPQKPEDSVESFVDNRMKLHEIYLHPDHVNKERDREFYTRLYQRAHYPAGFKRQLLAMICTGPITEKTKQINTPALIIHGDYDPAFPLEHGKHLAATLPHARLEIIEKMGHGLPENLCGHIEKLITDFYTEITRPTLKH